MLTRKDSTVPKTKRRIAEAALELFVRQGITETTTRDISGAAGIAEGTIYRHFESKEAIAEQLFLDDFLPFGQALAAIERGAGTGMEKIEAMIGHAYRAFDAQPLLWSYILHYQNSPRMKLGKSTPTPFNMLHKVIQQGIRSGEFRKMDASLAAEIVLGMAFMPATGLVFEELKGPLTPYLDTITESVRRVLTP